jgi:hypothetical protein
MGDSPENAHWFLAEIIEEIHVADDEQNIVHINLVLIRARSDEEAYEKAMTNGREGEISYENTDGQLVTSRFLGLRNLLAVYNDLHDGALLIYEERLGVPEEELQGYITPKDQLAVFSTGDGETAKPRYASKEVVDEVHAMLGKRPEKDEGAHDE